MHVLTRVKTPAIFLCALLIGFGIGFFIGTRGVVALENNVRQSLTPIEEQGISYTYVHPLLAYRTPEATVFGDYVDLKNDLQLTVSDRLRTGTTRASIYFRDLDASRWVGINQNDTYYPASLLKVPTLIALYKEAEEDPRVLDEVLRYDAAVLPDVPFEAPSALVPGRTYSTQELIAHMIADSDNGATFTLLNNLNPDFLHQVYVALGIEDPGDDSENYQISVRTYGLFFRILYNTTYLSPTYSEQALRLLSQATYNKGLVAGVPKGTIVAHKYGEHVLSEGGRAIGVELSDCGIVYYPSHPYLLCVMTRANDEETAAATIAAISHTTYTAVDKRYAMVK
jgi:beta-lactamase class A